MDGLIAADETIYKERAGDWEGPVAVQKHLDDVRLRARAVALDAQGHLPLVNFLRETTLEALRGGDRFIDATSGAGPK